MGEASGIVWGKGQVHTRFWWGNVRERNNLEELGGEVEIKV
jgi:hypothetical protein